MANWVRVAKLSEIVDGCSHELVAEDRMIALFRVGEELFALDGVCPHQGGPLGKGELRDHTVTCPWHGWQFDVRTGQHAANPTLQQPRLPVRVENGDVLVDIANQE